MRLNLLSVRKLNRGGVVIGFIGLVVALFGWALASPVGASPDEDFHMISAWCDGDGHTGVCQTSNNPGERLVSTALILSACYARDPEIGAHCQTEQQLFENSMLAPTTRGNFQGTYPTLFYSTMHVFTSTDIQASVIAMRLFNATLFSAVFVTLWLLLPKYWRKSLYFTVALTIVPLGLFLIPSINPSSWAIIGVIAAFFGTAGALQRAERKSVIPLASIAGLGVVIAGGARWDGLIYALIAAVAAFIAAKRFQIPRRIFWISLSSSLTILLIFLLFGGLDFISKLAGFAGNSENAEGRSALGVLAYNIASFTELWAGFSGANGLGWLDTAVPKTAWMTTATLLWGTLFLRLAYLKRIQIWVAAGLIALLIAVPIATLQFGNSIIGENVQARYIFPLFLVLVSTVLLTLRGEEQIFSTAQLLVVVLGLFVSQALAVYTNMTRYISGMGGGFTLNLNQAAAVGWWWPAGPSPMFVLAAAVVGFGMFLVMAFVVNKSGSPQNNEAQALAIKE